MSHPDSPAKVDNRILVEAADWLVQLHSGEASDEDRIACEQWRQSSQENARAWQHAEMLMNKLGMPPLALARPALRAKPAKRRTVLSLLAISAAGALIWGITDKRRINSLMADHRTGKGEIRSLQLADGTHIDLNANTVIDIRFDTQQRLIRLHEGEILIQTAKDTLAAPRPFFVETQNGKLKALGTHFNVRRDRQQTYLNVFEGAVRVTPKNNPHAQIIVTGHWQTSFTDNDVTPVTRAQDSVIAWKNQMLVVDNRPLSDVVSALSDYHTGYIHYDASIAPLPLSGAFPLNDIDLALSMITATYPVTATKRWNNLWITLQSRDTTP